MKSKTILCSKSLLAALLLVACTQETVLTEKEEIQIPERVPYVEDVEFDEGALTVYDDTELRFVTEYPNDAFHYKGRNLLNWEVVVGDGLEAFNSAPITINDIETTHQKRHSTVSANVDNRYIMVHNITYKKVVFEELFKMNHRAKYQFQIPYEVSTANIENNGQTVEGGLFVWDGNLDGYDYGLAFQWVTNPWVPEFGDIRYWDGDGWQYLTNIPVDQAYHQVRFILNFKKETAFLVFDGMRYTKNVYSKTPKVGWGNTIDGRLQAEVISLFPSPTAEDGEIPVQQVNFKRWSWKSKYFNE